VTSPAPDLDAFARLASARRSSLLVDRSRDVPTGLVERLCATALWAPNHHKTWPWRFTLATGDGRRRLGEVAAEAMATAGTTDEARLSKTRGKFLRAPAILVVGSAPDADPIRAAENRDAVAAGIQNLLLAATAAGLASFWSSCPPGADDAVSHWCGFETGSHVCAIVYLGWPTDAVSPPARPPLIVHRRVG